MEKEKRNQVLNQMQNSAASLSHEERIIFNTVFLFQHCNITRIREWLHISADGMFSTKEYVTKVPEILKKLVHDGWLVLTEREYSCSGRMVLPLMKSLLSFSDVQAQIDNSLVELGYRTHYELTEKLSDVYSQCCVAAILLKDYQKVELCQKLYEKSRAHQYYWRRKKNLLDEAFQYLADFAGFFDEIKDFPETLVQKFLPSVLLHLLFFCESPDQLLKLKCFRADQCAMFLTAAFLKNDTAYLKKIMQAALPNEKILGEAFLLMLAGSWKEADQKFTRYLNQKISGHYLGQENAQVLAAILIIALLAACILGAAPTRVSRWVEYLDNLHVCRGSSSVSQMLANLYSACQNKSVYEPDLPRKSLPLSYILCYPEYCFLPKASMTDQEIEEGIAFGKELLQRGQIVFGVYLLNCAGTLLPADDPKRSEIVALTAQYPVVPLLQMTRKKEAWENLLESLEKIAGKRTAVKKDSSSPDGRLYWLLDAVETEEKKYWKLQRMELYFSTLSKDGTFTRGRSVALKKVQDGVMDSFLSPEEQAVKGEISHYGACYSFNLKAIRCLIHSNNVFLNDTGHPVTLTEEKNCIISQINGRGETELSLKYFPTYNYYFSEDVFLDCSEQGVCRFCFVAGKNPLMEFWREHCNASGKLVIPRRGMEKLADTAAKISEVIPFSGILAKEAYRNLPSVNGGVELHARLIREDDGGFLIEFFNKPSPDFDWMVRPGKGQEEKVLGKAEKQILLHREFSQETRAWAELLSCCPAVPASARTDFNCELEDPGQSLSVLAQLKESGIIMDWNNSSPLKISQKIEFSQLRLSGSPAASWFAVGGELKISEEKVLSLQEVLNALEHKVGNFIQLDENSYLQLTRDLMKKLELLKVSGTMTKGELNISPAALPMLSSAFDDGLPENLLKQLAMVKEVFRKKINLPSNLNGELRSYQEDGFRYLARLADCRIGCCLADDMGLGKTIQLLALLLREAPQGPALVVCPASLCRNWEREAQKFAPSLHTQILPMLNREAIIQKADKGDLILCSYGIVQSEVELFSTKKWHVVILDEAQAIKNHTAKRSKSTKDLQADIRIASTGTPIENHLLELWSIFDFLNPGLLGGSTTFEQKFCNNGMPRPELKKLVSPLILRRRKGDVLEDLPPKTEITLPVELTEEERTMYEVLRRKAVEELEGAQEKSRIEILAYLTKLRRFCCDPALSWEGAAEGTKVKRLAEVAADLKAAGHRALVFSQYVDFLEIIRKVFDRNGLSYQYLDGSTTPARRMKAVDAFQNGEGDFFLISLKAGGVGLNLTAANYVIIADPWWNPAVEDQAADRVHRIGQREPVTVYRLIAADTVEEKILELHARKKKVSDDILSNVESSGVTAAELMALLGASSSL